MAEPEADWDQGKLSVTMGERRRSGSFTDDYSIHKTNDDATYCKRAAVQLGYYDDPFINRFVQASSSTNDMPIRRDPEISRGYWARVKAFRTLIDQFLQKAGPSCQILNFGAGFDTLYWRLKEEGAKFRRYVDVDFSSVTAKKIRMIRKPGKPDLVSIIANDSSTELYESGHTDLHGGDYHVVGADLRQARELHEKLVAAEVDFSLPTVIVCECVLIYMAEEQSASLLKYLADSFPTVCFINYEQVNLSDTFGAVMQRNLNTRGINLAGMAACQSLESQKKRYFEIGECSLF
uniref:Leucine carboxyl methyltransferase 1 n=1 Tax=Plectus sambesii TaxID=2011161 RepID=A0A914UKV3_9BILA